MKEQARGVFLCPDCGTPSTVIEDGRVACQECKKYFAIPERVVRRVVPPAAKVSTGVVQRNIPTSQKAITPRLQKSQLKSASPIKARPAVKNMVETPPSEVEHHRKNFKKREKSSRKTYLTWFLFWFFLVAIIFGMISFVKYKEDAVSTLSTTMEERLQGKEKDFYRREFPKIHKTFESYLTSRSPSDISNFTLKVTHLERKINRYAKENRFRRLSSGLSKDPVFWNVAFEETPGFVEIIWGDGSAGPFEAVFSKVGDRWKLDWEQHVRYSEPSWVVFSQRISNINSGVFRVFIEKISDDEDGDEGPWLRVRLVPPYQDVSRQASEASEPILLDKNGEIAARIEQMFIDRLSQSAGYSEFWQRDDSKYCRVLVRLKWEANRKTGKSEIVIQEILADNWRTIELEP